MMRQLWCGEVRRLGVAVSKIAVALVGGEEGVISGRIWKPRRQHGPSRLELYKVDLVLYRVFLLGLLY